MRVAIISRSSPDYLIDIVMNGVVRLLGRENVSLEYGFWSQRTGQYANMLQELDTPNLFPVEEADILIASDRSLNRVDEWIKRTGKSSVAIVDGEDDADIREPWPSRIKMYFKREYIKGRRYSTNVRPLPFGMIPEPLPEYMDVEKKVSFRAFGTVPFRKEILDALVAMGHEISWERVSKDEYNKELAGSLVGVSVRGTGWDTYRYWETLYFGTALLSQRLPLVIPEEPVEGQEVVYFENSKDFRVKLEELLSNEEKTLGIGAAGRKACMSRHLSEHRAKTVLEALA